VLIFLCVRATFPQHVHKCTQQGRETGHSIWDGTCCQESQEAASCHCCCRGSTRLFEKRPPEGSPPFAPPPLHAAMAACCGTKAAADSTMLESTARGPTSSAASPVKDAKIDYASYALKESQGNRRAARPYDSCDISRQCLSWSMCQRYGIILHLCRREGTPAGPEAVFSSSLCT
jgi:hypothetical protein